MRVALADLNNAMNITKQIAQDTAATGVLVEVRNNEIAFIFCDNKKAVYRVIEAQTTAEEEEIGKVVLEYSSLTTGLQKIQPTGNIQVNTVDINMSELRTSNIVTLEAEKVIYRQYEDGFDVEKVSKINSPIKAYEVKEGLDKKFNALARFDYNSMLFENSGVDIWDKAELISILKKFSKGDTEKTCYVLRDEKAGFSIGRNCVTYIKCYSGLDQYAFTVNCKVARSVIEILNKLSADTVNLFTKEKRYCSIVSDDNKFGIWFEMAPYKAQDGKILQQFQKDGENFEFNREYSNVAILLNKEAVVDVVKSLKLNDKNDAATIRLDFNDSEALHNKASLKTDEEGNVIEGETEGFTEEQTGNVALIMGDAKRKNVLKVFAKAKISDKKPIEELSLNYTIWDTILSICDGDYVKLSINVNDEKSNYLKFEDLIVDEDGNTQVKSTMYTLASNKEK